MATPGSTSEELSLNKISQQKILRLSSDNVEAIYYKVKILSISCKNVKEVLELLKKLDCKNYPKAFVISINIENVRLSLIDRWIKNEKDPIDQVKDKIKEKFLDSHQFLFQINSKNFFWENQRLNELKTNLNEEEIRKSFDDSNFSTETFLNIQKGSNFCDADFVKFLKFEKVAHKLFLNAINSGDDFCFRLLKLFDLNVSQEIQDEIFLAVIKSQNLRLFLAFLDVFDQSQIKDEELENILKIKREENFQRIFLIAVECQNLEVLNFLLKCCEKLLSFEYLKNVFDLSVSKKFDDITRVLQGPFDAKIREEIEKLHENIESGNLKGVEEFSKKISDQRLCLNSQNICALERAIDCKQFRIFSFLRTNNFYTERGSDLEAKIESLEVDEKEEIRVENLIYNKNFPNAFIGVLLSKCKFDACSPVSSNSVRKMLTDLSRVDELRPFLEIASQARIEIIFDFKTKSVKTMVPEYDEHTMGLAFLKEGKLYVGRDRDKQSRYGSFIHELTHMVLYLIYENGGLPYCKGDDQREREWAQIKQAEFEKFELKLRNFEPIIQWVFQYYEEGHEQLAELAVRPNHIMARYLDEPEKVEELRSAHGALFSFIRDKVLPDLKVPNILRLIKLNNDFGVIEKIEEFTLNLKPSKTKVIFKESMSNLILTSNIPKLAFLKLYDDIKSSSQSPLDIKTKNIFVDAEKTFDEELFNLLKNSKVDRVILDGTDEIKAQKVQNMLDSFPQGPQVIFVCHEENSIRFQDEKIYLKINFDDLSQESREEVKATKVKFQGKCVEVSRICESVFDEIFSLLCNEKEILINPVRENINLENFIPPTILDPSNNEFDLESFLDSVQQNQVVLISNFAGSGKTTLLKKIFENFLTNYPTHWISFVSLIDHVDELLIDDIQNEEEQKSKHKENMQSIQERNIKIFDMEGRKNSGRILKSFEEKMIKILKPNKVEEKIFLHKFSNGEVKILFDGFDEISPKCKKQTLNFFKKFQSQNQNQIFITTRTHLEQDLKKILKVESFQIKIFTDEDQIKFLTDFWKKSNPDESFNKECAQDLTKKISEMIKDYQNLIGIPLISQSVAKLHTSKIDEHFKDEIKNLKISDVFKKLIEQSLLILESRFPSTLIKNSLKRSNIFQALEYITIVNYFDEEFAISLGLSIENFEETWSLEEVVRTGILSYDENKKVKFNHEIYGQYFLSTIMENILKTFSSLSDPQIELLQIILTDEKFAITRMFLNENLEELMENDQNFFNDSNVSNLNSRNFFEKLSKSLRNEILLHKNTKSETILHLSVKLGSFETFKNVVESIEKNLSKEIQKELIQSKDDKYCRNVLMISTYRNENSFKLLLEFVFELMEKNEIRNFLNEKDKWGDNLLLHAALFVKSKEIFEFLWLKIFEIFKDQKEELKNYLKVKGFNGRNLLMRTENSNLDSIKFLWKVFEDTLSRDEIFELLIESDEDGVNFLHLAEVFAESKEIFEFMWMKVFEIFKDEKENVKSYLKSFKGKNLLMMSTQKSNLDLIQFLWKIFEENLSRDEIFELLNEKDENGDNFLHLAAIFTKSRDIFEFFWLKIFEIFKDEKAELKNYLKVKGFRGRNLLMMSIFSNENSFFYIFENIFEKFFDFKAFIYECDDYGENFLHLLTQFGSLSMVEFVFKKLEEKLTEHELKRFLMTKSYHKHNLLHFAVFSNHNSNSSKFWFSKVEKFVSDEEFKEMLNQTDADGDVPLHICIQDSTTECFEFYTKNYEENFTKDEIKDILISRDFIKFAEENKKDPRMRLSVEDFYNKLYDDYTLLI